MPCKGVFNVALTNQFVTPPTTTNPFGFVDQAKQFSLVLNAELPLVRVAERNNFRAGPDQLPAAAADAENTEDFDQVSSSARTSASMQLHYLNYEIAKRNLVLTIRQKDQAFEQIIAPPAGGRPGRGQPGAAPDDQPDQLPEPACSSIENQLVTTWYQLPAGPTPALPRPRHLALRRMGGLP